MSLNIDGKKSFHDCWKLLLHYAFISPHWGGREIKLLIFNFINSLIYSESHIKQNFALKYLSIPGLLCARYFSKAQENEDMRHSLIYDGNEWDLLPNMSNTSSASEPFELRSAVNVSRNPVAITLVRHQPAHQRISLSFVAAFIATVEAFRSRLINGTEDSLSPGNTQKYTPRKPWNIFVWESKGGLNNKKTCADCILKATAQRNTVQASIYLHVSMYIMQVTACK